MAMDRERIEKVAWMLHEHARKPYTIGRLHDMRIYAAELCTLLGKDQATENGPSLEDVAGEQVSPPIGREDPTVEIKT